MQYQYAIIMKFLSIVCNVTMYEQLNTYDKICYINVKRSCLLSNVNLLFMYPLTFGMLW